MPLLKNIRELYVCKDEGGQGAVHSISDGAVAWGEVFA